MTRTIHTFTNKRSPNGEEIGIKKNRHAIVVKIHTAILTNQISSCDIENDSEFADNVNHFFTVDKLKYNLVIVSDLLNEK